MDSWNKRIAFLQRLEQLKLVERANMVVGGNRPENSAEHSWHVAMMALILAPEIAPDVNLLTVLKMLLIHDIVEIEAGDTFIYSEEVAYQEEKEEKALEVLAQILPLKQGEEFKNLWYEFEKMETKEARFAKALDHFQPIMNYYQVGKIYTDHEPVSIEKVIEKKAWIQEISPLLWETALQYIKKCKEQGLYK
ncbi:MAG: HD domain-containing protein [Tissierellia bacterium]|nr:HD domain-containing protein [Tissierellia bacterium]